MVFIAYDFVLDVSVVSNFKRTVDLPLTKPPLFFFLKKKNELCDTTRFCFFKC